MPAFLQQDSQRSVGGRARCGRAPPAGMRLLEQDPSATEQPLPLPLPSVKKWTVSRRLWTRSTPLAVTSEPTSKRGRSLFAAASCSKCHRVGRLGIRRSRFDYGQQPLQPQADLLESIVEPSKSIAENYRSLRIPVTTDGKVYVRQRARLWEATTVRRRCGWPSIRNIPFKSTEIDKRTDRRCSKYRRSPSCPRDCSDIALGRRRFAICSHLSYLAGPAVARWWPPAAQKSGHRASLTKEAGARASESIDPRRIDAVCSDRSTQSANHSLRGLLDQPHQLSEFALT